MQVMKDWKRLSLLALTATTLLVSGCDDDNDGPAPSSAPVLQSGSNNPVVLGLTDEGQLVSFRANAPGTIAGRVPLTGEVVDNPSNPPIAVSADYRPSTGVLYVLFNDDRLYTVNLDNGALTLVAQIAFPAAAVVESIDFNPIPDLIRALSSGTDQGNFRVRPADGSIPTPADTVMSYLSGDENAGNAPSIDGVAYTGFSNATATTAYVLDTTQDVLATLGSLNGSPNSPNTGLLETVGDLNIPIGGGSGVGFDIPTADATVGFVSDAGDDQTSFYRINLANGALTLLGTVPGERLLDIVLVPGTGVGGTPSPAPTPTPNPTPNPPTPTTIGVVPGDAACDRAFAGAGFTPTKTDGDSGCLLCDIDPIENLTDTDFSNFATANLSGLLLAVQSVTVEHSGTGTFTPAAGTLVGGVFSVPGGDPGELALLPGVTVETLNNGEVVQSAGVDSSLLRADLMGFGLTNEEKFFAGIVATEPFDTIRFVFDGGVVGVNTTVNLFYACASAPSNSEFPGLLLPIP